MPTNKLLIASLSAIISGGAIAGTMGSIEPTSWLRVMTLSIGSSWTNSGETQTFYLQPNIKKTFSASKNTHALPSGEFFFGWQRLLNPTITGQLGLALAASGNAKLNGDIWENASPNFNNFFYAYQVNHAHVAVKGKVLADIKQMVQPYVSGSLGLGRNRVHDFTITKKIYEEIPPPAFQSNTTTAFTYTLGLGSQKALTPNWQAGVGYEFADWGKSNLARAPGQTLGGGLQLSHLYTHQLQFSLSYLA
jgi:opacity protein-like surface antigen